MLETRYGSTERQIRNELLDGRLKRGELAFRLSVLRSLYPRLFHDTAVLGVIRLNTKDCDPCKPSLQTLKGRYDLVAQSLSESFNQVTRQTTAEIILKKTIPKLSDCRFIPSVWIGNKNVDVFIPTITGVKTGSKRFCGVAVEVDGTVHDLHAKMLKDNEKEELLTWLNIITLRIGNNDLFTSQALQPFKTSLHFHTADTRAKRRMWQKIYLVTIFMNATEDDIEDLFNIDLYVFRKKFQRVLTGKSL